MPLTKTKLAFGSKSLVISVSLRTTGTGGKFNSWQFTGWEMLVARPLATNKTIGQWIPTRRAE